jgi:hypothetical protein
MAWSALEFIDGAPVRNGKVTLAFPIPSIPAIIGLVRCFQFVCVDLNAPSPCIGVSQGLVMTFMP